ncbi:MAG: hypothetical protein EOP06_29915 [Proteobacteria bacterium]|nr:MAG: hypothetical protein EOP06_29915 [Pseudomonadota bacterium]
MDFSQDVPMKIPAFKRVEELDHPSEGWPSISEYGVRRIRILMCVIALLSALVSFMLPIIGADGFFRQFNVPHSWTAHFEMLGKQLLAPVLLLLLNGFFIYCVLSRKRIPLWTPAFGLIVCGEMVRNVGYVSHDFSHVVFAECSGIYGNLREFTGIYGNLRECDSFDFSIHRISDHCELIDGIPRCKNFGSD